MTPIIRPLLLTLALALAPGLAPAHSKPMRTTPEDGATVSAVPVLALRFDDPMRVISFTLRSPEGAVEITRETGMEPVTDFSAAPAN